MQRCFDAYVRKDVWASIATRCRRCSLPAVAGHSICRLPNRIFEDERNKLHEATAVGCKLSRGELEFGASGGVRLSSPYTTTRHDGYFSP
jgi:hypothetical protein